MREAAFFMDCFVSPADFIEKTVKKYGLLRSLRSLAMTVGEGFIAGVALREWNRPNIVIARGVASWQSILVDFRVALFLFLCSP